MTLDPSTPVLIGVGQAVDHWDGSDAAAAPSPQSLMQRAAEAALADTGAAEAVRAAIDVVTVVRHFADSAPGMVPEGTGGCDKPPLGLAERLGVTPARAIYSIVGGQSPQSLVNEFAANSLKHAFPEGRPGRIAVRLAREGARLRLEVCDDGIGLPAPLPEVDGAARRRGLGFQIMEAAAAQAGGEFELVPSARGLAVAVHFAPRHDAG